MNDRILKYFCETIESIAKYRLAVGGGVVIDAKAILEAYPEAASYELIRPISKAWLRRGLEHVPCRYGGVSGELLAGLVNATPLVCLGMLVDLFDRPSYVKYVIESTKHVKCNSVDNLYDYQLGGIAIENLPESTIGDDTYDIGTLRGLADELSAQYRLTGTLWAFFWSFRRQLSSAATTAIGKYYRAMFVYHVYKHKYISLTEMLAVYVWNLGYDELEDDVAGVGEIYFVVKAKIANLFRFAIQNKQSPLRMVLCYGDESLVPDEWSGYLYANWEKEAWWNSIFDGEHHLNINEESAILASMLRTFK